MNAMRVLPFFRFHPEPLKTEAFVKQDIACPCCGGASAFAYTGPFFCCDRPEILCPWCIADGSAAQKYEGVFLDADCIKVGYGMRLAPEIIDELTRRTPGFHGAQQQVWFCFGDLPGAYQGDFNCMPEPFMTEEFWEQVCETNEMWSDRSWFNDMRKFSMTGSVSLHVFKDLDSDKRTGYFDYT